VSLTACAMDWGLNRILRVGENSGPILSRFRPKFMKFWGDIGKHSGPLVYPNAFARLSMSCFVQKIVCH